MDAAPYLKTLIGLLFRSNIHSINFFSLEFLLVDHDARPRDSRSRPELDARGWDTEKTVASGR